MLSYVESIRESTTKRRNGWNKCIKQKSIVKPDMTLITYLFKRLNTAISTYEIFNIEKEHMIEIIEDYVCAIKLLVGIDTIINPTHKSRYRFRHEHDCSNIISQWSNLAYKLYTDFNIKKMTVLCPREIQNLMKRNLRLYAKWISKMSSITNNNTILFPIEVDHKSKAFKFLFHYWVEHTQHPKGFPQQFKSMYLLGEENENIVYKLFNTYGIKIFDTYPELIHYEKDVEYESEYIYRPMEMFDLNIHENITQNIVDVWKKMHPNLLLSACLIYSKSIYAVSHIIRNKILEEDKDKVDRNGLSLAMIWVIVYDGWSLPVRLRKAHKAIFGDDNQYISIISNCRENRAERREIDVDNAKFKEDKCPICYEPFKGNKCMEFPCGHIICSKCASSMEICMYRCKEISFDDDSDDMPDVLKRALMFRKIFTVSQRYNAEWND